MVEDFGVLGGGGMSVSLSVDIARRLIATVPSVSSFRFRLARSVDSALSWSNTEVRTRHVVLRGLLYNFSFTFGSPPVLLRSLFVISYAARSKV